MQLFIFVSDNILVKSINELIGIINKLKEEIERQVNSIVYF